jgi:hypothetical protein
MLSTAEAAGLRGVCKALKALVMRWAVSVEARDAWDLEAALTCFPATESFKCWSYEIRPSAEAPRMVELLRGHGGTLKRVEVGWEGSRRLLSSAVLAGALPSLTYFDLSPEHAVHRLFLSRGMLRLLEDVRVRVRMDKEEQVEALGHLADLPHLRRRRLFCERAGEASFPPFIPPSLKTLILHIKSVDTIESLFRELPSMLEANGASLEEIETAMPVDTSLALVLRTCSSTLKTVKLTDPYGRPRPECIRDVMPCLVSCCDTLEVLHCPGAVFSSLPAASPAFPRLNELRLEGGASVVTTGLPACVMMADGRLPALASLEIKDLLSAVLWGPGGALEARPLEGVAGTLRRLSLRAGSLRAGSPAGASYELGLAIGKLRRLRYLELNLFRDGRDYHAVARGMAASGGCPQLSEVVIGQPPEAAMDGLSRNADWLALEPSLIVPSVRDLCIRGCGTEEEALLLCCGLVQAGHTKYRLTLDLELRDPDDPDDNDFDSSAVLACMRDIMCAGGINAEVRLEGWLKS